MKKKAYKNLCYEMAEQLNMAIGRLRATSSWTGNLVNNETGEVYSWEESFARSIEKLSGCKVDRRWIETKYLPKKQRDKAWAELRAEIEATREAALIQPPIKENK